MENSVPREWVISPFSEEAFAAFCSNVPEVTDPHILADRAALEKVPGPFWIKAFSDTMSYITSCFQEDVAAQLVGTVTINNQPKVLHFLHEEQFVIVEMNQDTEGIGTERLAA